MDQPAKLVAIETHWETGRRVPITLFAIPDEKTEAKHFSVDVPFVGSLIKGLKDFPADQRPPVALPFFAFRIMVGCGLVMLGILILGGWRGRWRMTQVLDFVPIWTLILGMGVSAGAAGGIPRYGITRRGGNNDRLSTLWREVISLAGVATSFSKASSYRNFQCHHRNAMPD